MSSRYNRPPSPSDRWERNDPYYSRSSRSGGVVPISTQTYVNGVPVSSRATYDTYTDPRRSIGTIPSDSPERRPSVTAGPGGTSRAKAAVVHNGIERPASPTVRTSKYRYDTAQYVTPESSDISRRESKKVYAVEDGRTARVLDTGRSRDVDERSGGRKGYHASGTGTRTSLDDYGRYDRVDARGLYADTETRARPRRDGGDVPSGRRASIDGFGIIAPRLGAREAGPPPATRGIEKISNTATRHGSLRDTPRSPQYNRDRVRGSYSDDEDTMSTVSAKLMPTSHNPLIYERAPFSPVRDNFDNRFEADSRRSNYEDSDVASRGFGIRSGNAAVPFLRESGREAVPHLEPPTAAVPYPRTSNVDLRSDYSSDDPKADLQRSERRRDADVREREKLADRSRDHGESRRARENDYDDNSKYRHREHRRDRDRDKYEDDERRTRDKRSDRDDHSERRDKDRDKDREERRARHDDSIAPEVLTALAAGGAAAFGANELLSREKAKDAVDREDRDKRDRPREARDRERDRDRSDRPKEPAERDERERRERVRDPIESDRERDREREKRDRDRERERERLREVQEREERERRERPRDAVVVEERDKSDRKQQPQPLNEDAPRERHYIIKEDPHERPDQQAPPAQALDPDEEYRRRVQLEMERTKQARGDEAPRDPALADESRRRPREERAARDLPAERSRPPEVDERAVNEPLSLAGVAPPDAQALAPYAEQQQQRQGSIVEGAPLSDEPSDLEGSQSNDRRVRILEPPKDKEQQQPALKGILRRPTNKFPEHPNNVREGVAPLKDATKKGIPPGARWTRIDRRLVNPDALDEAKERYEERQDSVIVLRVLTKEEIQKFAERTKEIRDERYEQRHRRPDAAGTGDEYDDKKEDEDKPRQLTWDG